MAAAVVIAAAALLIVRESRDATRARSEVRLTPPPAPAIISVTADIDYKEAKPILEVFSGRLPKDLASAAPGDLPAAWPGWVSRHNAEIRARLARGDEDTLINFWLYGTTFTTRPRATARDVAALGDPKKTAELMQRRFDDLLAGMAASGTNDRLRFARQVIERQGIDPTTAEGHDRAWDYLVAIMARSTAEYDGYRRTLQSTERSHDDGARQSVSATLYRHRGLSSDTRINVDFSIDQALDALSAQGPRPPGSVRHVAIVGPGLDFTDKAEGYDFYPEQTIQPFAVIDSLLRLGLATPSDLRVVTFDLSPRVNQHLEAARQRAQGGDPYVLQFPLDRDVPSQEWDPQLVTYWQQVGARIGDDVAPLAPPPGANVQMRAVRVRPGVVLSISPRDLNIVLERVAPLKDEDRFDLIVATNILLYYDAFEQALALANVSAMLRPGGVFLTNYKVAPTAPMESSPSLITKVYWDRQRNGDTIFGYQRR
jgi:SAM-dependent methyltransferase